MAVDATTPGAGRPGADRPRGSAPGMRPAYPPPGGPRVDPLAEKIAWWLDDAFAIGNVRFGLDPLLGLVPGAGDMVTSLFGVVLVVRAAQQGVRLPTLLRMIANLMVDSALGSLSFVGDAFDFFWRAHRRNLQIYREALAGTRDVRADAWFVAAVAVLAAIAVLLPLLLVGWLLLQLAQGLGSGRP